MQPQHTYREDFAIRSSEVSPNGNAQLHSICGLLQEAAGNHALSLDFDISQLMEKNLTWVLHRLHIKMNSYPEWRDTITVKTWPSSGDTLRAYRDFEIIDKEGKKIGKALSYWLMLNTESRRPVRMPDEILSMAPSNIQHVIDIKKERHSPLESADLSKTFDIRRSDLDMNRHVNNVKYIEWALEMLPGHIQVGEMDIEFHFECTDDDIILSEAFLLEEEKESKHQLKRKKDNKIVALASMKFKG